MVQGIKNINSETPIFGDKLTAVCTHREARPIYMMPGRNRNNENIAIPIGESILSRHMLFLGGIGTGKTNAMNLFIRNTRRVMTDRDVMVIFDTKGDYYREFYEPGDIVISNDERATGIRGTDYSLGIYGALFLDPDAER